MVPETVVRGAGRRVNGLGRRGLPDRAAVCTQNVRRRRGGGEREDVTQVCVVSTPSCSVMDPGQAWGMHVIRENRKYMQGASLGLGGLEDLS